MILFSKVAIKDFPFLPGYNTGNQPSHLRWEPLLSRPIGNGVDKDKAKSVAGSHRQHDQSEH